MDVAWLHEEGPQIDPQNDLLAFCGRAEIIGMVAA